MGCFVVHFTAMQLMMYIGNDHVESVTLDPGRISKPGYLGSFKRTLKMKYSDLIKQHGSPADFIVVNSPMTSAVTRQDYTRDKMK